MDHLKSYVMVYPNYKSISEDERMIIGSIILEYLAPLMEDTHIFENHIIQFFYELALIKKEHISDLVF